MWDFSTLRFDAYRGFSLVKLPLEFQASESELRERKITLAAAVAVCWDAHNVTVLCPFCHKLHHHGINFFAVDQMNETSSRVVQDQLGRFQYYRPSPHRCESRAAHCNHDVDISIHYTILFPFEKDLRVAGLSFEVETTRVRTKDGMEQRFRTVGLAVPELTVSEPNGNDAEEEFVLQRGLEQMNIEGVHFGPTAHIGDGVIKRRAWKDLAFYAVCGDLKSIESILGKFRNEEQLIRNFKDEKGQSLLHLTVPNGHSEVVKFLLEKGADINSLDNKGRTPLMEGALWGYVEIVHTLISKGADTTIRERQGRQAPDFAEESERNDEERHQRHIKYAENPFVKKRHRRLIRALIKSKVRKQPAANFALNNLQDACFYKSRSASSISFIVHTQGIHITRTTKTAGLLYIGPSFPVLAAVSGWTGQATEEFRGPEAGFERLNEAYWQNEIFKIAKELDFIFDSHHYDDPRIPGSFNASHAEPQLMSYFIRKHYVFRDYKDGETVEDDFLQLFMLQPRQKLAHIIVSKAPCGSCLKLAESINQKLGIMFNFHTPDLKE